jgi:hypothetical protein
MDRVTNSTAALPDRVAPAACTWQHRSTQEVRAGDRFEFCRELAPGSHVECPLATPGDFFGEFRYTATPAGTCLPKSTSTPASRDSDRMARTAWSTSACSMPAPCTSATITTRRWC